MIVCVIPIPNNLEKVGPAVVIHSVMVILLGGMDVIHTIVDNVIHTITIEIHISGPGTLTVQRRKKNGGENMKSTFENKRGSCENGRRVVSLYITPPIDRVGCEEEMGVIFRRTRKG